MSEVVHWRRSVTGEETPLSKMQWIASNKQRLLKAFPKGEQSFCRIIDKMISRLGQIRKQWKRRLWYTRQKHFLIDPEVFFFGDFYFRNARVLVEIDGAGHTGKNDREKDAWRTKLISTFRDTTVIRFTNGEVIDGDFRLVEATFVNAVAAKIGGIGQLLLREYEVMRKRHPHIYAETTPQRFDVK